MGDHAGRWMFWPRSWTIRVRMVVLAGTVAALLNLAVSALVVIGVHGQAVDFQQGRTADAALTVVARVKRRDLPAILNVPKVHAVQVIDHTGRVVSSSGNLVGKGPIESYHPPLNTVYGHQTLCPPHGLEGCQVVVTFRVYESGGDWFVYATNPVVPWYTSPLLLTFVTSLGLLVTMLVMVGAYRTVDTTLKPVEAIRAELAEITAKELGRRVPVPPHHDEVRLLAETVNATLDRLADVVEQQRQFTSDASHDLRSPITAMRTQVEASLWDTEDTDWPTSARAMLASLDRLQAIVTDLLILSRLDARQPQVGEEIDLGQVVRAELERRPRGRRIDVRLAEHVTVRGDPVRLGRLLTNLLDNAERHARESITVTVAAAGDEAIIEVVDDGSGIAADQREVVFRRFTRLDASRNRDVGGTGLGLPIARQIAEAHGGTLMIEDSPVGARFVLRLPRLGA